MYQTRRPSTPRACPTVGQAGGTLSCPLGTIPPGAQATVQVVVRPPVAGTLTNTFGVRMAERDPTPAGNPSTTITPVNNPSPERARSTRAGHGE